MKPDKIILHHSLTKDSCTVSIGAIRNYHKNIMGWSDIGYHFLIENLRNQTEIVLGRMLNRTGAHCRGFNKDSIGICFVGNYDNEYPSDDSWNKGIKLVKYLIQVYGIKIVLGHRELNKHKTCPGKLFDLNRFRKEIGL